MNAKHTDREYESELESIRQRILLMAGRVEKMIADSVDAFISRDRELASRILDDDRRVDLDEVEIDEMCLLVLARRQPLASDLRLIVLSLKMTTDLERIGDLTVNVAERALEPGQAGPAASLDDLAALGGIVQSMIKNAIDALVERDVDKARRVIAKDADADAIYHRIFRDALDRMIHEIASVEDGIRTQTVAKLLERMADHGTNLAEEVIYMVHGRDVRHSGTRGRKTDT